MTKEDASLYPYQIAYMCGGPKRVAIATLVALWTDQQIKISRARHRIEEVRPAPRNSMEKAALEIIPDSAGKVLGPTVQAIANSSSVTELGQTLRDGELLPRSRVAALWQWNRISSRRNLRRRLLKNPPKEGILRVAVLGTTGITDEKLRDIFETPDPEKIDLPKMNLDFPVDPYYENNAPSPLDTPMY